jgi:hypothetical protein
MQYIVYPALNVDMLGYVMLDEFEILILQVVSDIFKLSRYEIIHADDAMPL